MSNAYSEALAQILTKIKTTWDCQAYRQEQGSRFSLQKEIERGALKPPFAVVQVAKMRRTNDRADGNAFLLPVTIIRVEAQKGGGDQNNDILSSLIELWGDIYQQTSAKYELMEEGTAFDVSLESEAAALIANTSAPFAAGCLTIWILIDLTP